MMARRPWVDAEIEQVRDTAVRFFERECLPHEERWAAQRHADRDIWARAGRAGLLCASIPQAYGGGGGTFLHDAAICEAQAATLAGGLSINVHSGIVAHYILAYGSEPQKQRWLPRLATGEWVGAIAMSEPNAGTDLQRIRTTATRQGGDYLIHGNKTFITNGYHADLIIVAVKTDQAAGAKGMSLVVVETPGLAGFRRGQPLAKLGQKTIDAVELFFDGARVPRANLLGEAEGQGFAQLMRQLPQERLLIAVAAVAGMHRAIADTRSYVQQRQVFGDRLMGLQNTRFTLAQCWTQATVARSFVDDCIMRLQRGELDVPTAAMAKWWATETHCRIIDDCLQLHGGYGYMTEYPIARMYADARVGKIYGGANEIMKEIIARSLDVPG
ncbi:acyl-CoA dehydrogenase [Bordetella petrii]|nr:acyl-CoA dehydrogenase [Bordetella petrii]